MAKLTHKEFMKKLLSDPELRARYEKIKREEFSDLEKLVKEKEEIAHATEKE